MLRVGNEERYHPDAVHCDGGNGSYRVLRSNSEYARASLWDRSDPHASVAALLSTAKRNGVETLMLAYTHSANDAELVGDAFRQHGFICNDLVELDDPSSYPDGVEREFAHYAVQQCASRLAPLTPLSEVGAGGGVSGRHRGSNTIRLVMRNVPYRFEGHLAPEEYERKPFLHFFMSGHSTDTDVFRLGMGSNDASGLLNFSLALDGDVVAVEDLPSINLNISCFTEVPNKHGVFCINQAGCSRAPVFELIEQAKRGTLARPEDITFDLVIPAMPEVRKARLVILLSAGSLSFEPREQFQRLQSISSSLREEEFVTHKEGRRLCGDYIETVFKRFASMKPTWPVIKNIHAYQFVSAVGILPAPAFHRFSPDPRTSEAFWNNLINIALGRVRDEWSWRGKLGQVPRTAEEFGEMASLEDDAWDEKGATQRRLSWLVLSITLTLYVNACRYITDKVDTNDRTGGSRRVQYDEKLVKLIESFDMIRMRECGDCEDFGKEEMLEAFSLMRLHKDAKRKGMALNAAVARLVRMRKKYYIFAFLGGVAGQEINVDYSSVKKMGAHEYVVLVPRWYFYECLERGAATSEFNARLNHAFLERRSKDRNTGRDCRVVVCEGTGMLWPEGTGDLHVSGGTNEEETVLQSTEELRNQRKMFRYDSEHRSRFYQTVTSAFTNEFFWRANKDARDPMHGVGEFVMAYAASGEPAGATYGVEFTDISKMSKRVVILAQPPMPDRLSDYLDRVQLDQHPIRELPPPMSSAEAAASGDASISRRLDLIRVLEKDSAPPARRRYQSSRAAVSFKITRFLNYKDVTADIVDHILYALRKLRSRKRDVVLRIVDEPVTMDETHTTPIGVYRLVYEVTRF